MKTNNKKGIILYQSKYGATKKYAEWLQEMTAFDCVETPKAVIDDAVQSVTILVVGGIYAAGLAVLTFLNKTSVIFKL